VETVSWRTRADQGESAENAETALQPVEDLGVGNRIARKLNVLGIKTALDLA
jgi:nucleotidyltransferase/DNA polymerase involved in DNA repair